MKKLRLLAGLYAALAAMTGCVVEVNFEPIGGDVSVDGAWTINGGVADATTCSAANIQTVRLQICEFADGDCYTDSTLQAACSAGGFTTSPFLLAGTYALRWQAVAPNGTVSNGEWVTVTALAGDTITSDANFRTDPTEDTLDAQWTIGGAAADATTCADAGIMNVRLTFYTDDQGATTFRTFTLPCSDGGFDSRTGMGPTLPDGMFYNQWEALDAAGAVIAATEAPFPELDTGAVPHATLATPDFPAGEPLLVLNIRYQLLGGAEDGTCAEAMIANNGTYMFLLTTSTGALVTLDPPITTCVNQVELPGLPADTYSLEVAGEATDGTKYGSVCGGLSYAAGAGTVMYDCFVDIQ